MAGRTSHSDGPDRRPRRLDRRQFVTSAGLALAACRSPSPTSKSGDSPLDRLFAAHSNLPPENGSGANHYPMAAEAMMALGSDAIPVEWYAGASYYRADLARRAAIDADRPPFGDRSRHGDWLDYFRAELTQRPWREVLRHWTHRLTPGLSGALFHGLLRTAHAVRALRHRASQRRREELAAGLAYWASCHTALPTRGAAIAARSIDARHLAQLEHPWLTDRRDVEFHASMERLVDRPLAPQVEAAPDLEPAVELLELKRAAAAAFLEMLVQQRHRIWLLHGFTGPAAIDLLLPDLDPPTGRELVRHAGQAVLALFAAYGAPFEPGVHVREEVATWPELARQAVARQSIHGLKLVEALYRSDDERDLLMRSVAAQWFDWV